MNLPAKINAALNASLSYIISILIQLVAFIWLGDRIAAFIPGGEPLFNTIFIFIITLTAILILFSITAWLYGDEITDG